MKKVTEKIDEKKYYNISEMVALGVFDDISHYSSYKNRIIEDKVGENLLKVKITGTGRGTDYKILGKNIINYLEQRHGEK